MQYIKTEQADILKGAVAELEGIVYEQGVSNQEVIPSNCVNGTFFAWQADSFYFSTSPLVLEGRAYRWASNNGKPQACLIVWKDQTVTMGRINNLSELEVGKIRYLFGGVGLTNKTDKRFMYDPEGEGFVGPYEDIFKVGQKTVIGYKAGDIYLVSCKLPYKGLDYDVLDLCNDLAFEMAIGLAGDGCSFLKYGQEYKVKGDGRKIHSIVRLNGVDTTPKVTQSEKVNIILLDAGHSTTTNGRETHVFADTNKCMKEREFNHAVVLAMMDYLKAYQCEVYYVSQRDIPEVTLDERVQEANKIYEEAILRYGREKVNCIFVSIHANHDGSKDWSLTKGIETYVYTGADKALADKVQEKLITATGLSDRKVKEDSLYVLKHTKMPAILTKNGFMSHEEEAYYLRSEAYRKTIAKATVDGISTFMQLEKNEASLPCYRVVCGSFNKLEEAEKRLNTLQSKGYKEVFIVTCEK